MSNKEKQLKSFEALQVNASLMHALMVGTQEGLAMTGLTPPPIGISRTPDGNRELSVIVGLVGKATGNVAINITERGALHLVSAFMMEEYTELNEDALDALMELGNIIAGRVKELLAETEFHVEQISLPSVVFGSAFSMHYSRGIKTCSVVFELEGMPLQHYRDAFFSTSVSLLSKTAY